MKPNNEVSIENQRRYMKPPTLEEIELVLKKLDVPAIHFERFHGIPEGTIAQIKRKNRNLAAPYWHHIYSKLGPKSIFKNSVTSRMTNNDSAKPSKYRTKVTNTIIKALK